MTRRMKTSGHIKGKGRLCYCLVPKNGRVFHEKNCLIIILLHCSDNGGRRGHTSKHEKFKESPDWQSDVVKAKGKEKLEQHESKEILDCKRLGTDIDSDIHSKQKVSISKPEIDINGSKPEELVQQHQQKHDEPDQLRAKRRRRVLITNEQVLEQSRR